MHSVKIAVILAAALGPHAVSAQSETGRASTIDVQPNGASGYRMILKSYRSSTVPAGQEELVSKAAELCAPRRASFGRYSFEMTEPVARHNNKPTLLVLRQDIECGRATAALPAPGAHGGPAPRMATPEQISGVEKQTKLYFEARDQGRYSGAYELMAESLKQAMTFATWKGKIEAFNAKAGAVEQRTIVKITWYHNPPQVEPGLYAAVDFTSKFARVDLHCGFLAWREQPDGKFVLVREEENYLDRETQKKLKPGEFEKARQQFGCK